ncbi:LysE family transporter [Variovorax sp. PCZ-1]|uniref:LysE/ArgO family amino acid transporter n=1 Tax=Variovorax sp. PCZ-1 TaxID=2835533 RepID=UPI001BCC78DD|nr:LysE family transporter [Variovorax sp. PCZ-1]MBS7806448.1 LysE family transporter [Variovorax sp. PCZ-1]
MNIFFSGMLLSLSLIVAIGPQNAHVLRMGLLRSHVGITIAACAITDLLLICIGVFGLAKLGNLSPAINTGLVGAAILFLINYGWQAAKRARLPAHEGLKAAQKAAPKSAGVALSSALAFSWLNPHAWIDTAVIIGTASLAYGAPSNWLFGMGAAAGSAIWFITLGLGAAAMAKQLAHPAVWRAIDVLVVITMWGTAAWLAVGLFKT